MSLTTTASGQVEFSSQYFGKPLSEWVILFNKSISKNNEFRTIRITVGKFGHDVLTTMLSNIFICIQENMNDILLYTRNKLDPKPYLELLHGSWVGTYLYWKNFHPHINDGYTAPKKEIFNDFYNNRATTYYEKLPEDIQQMYTEILNNIFELISEIVLSEGMKQLSM
jgi:hypothetical protein